MRISDWSTYVCSSDLEQVNREMAVADAATIAYDTSHHTDLSAQRGAQVVQQTVEVMHRIAQQMQEASDGIEALDKQSQLIGAILKTISGIADKTNLLRSEERSEGKECVSRCSSRGSPCH